MEGFIGQIMLFAGNFAPRNWAFCDGQLLPIAQNTALFSILGTTYGGDGRTTFALPDARGRAAIHPGNGPGLTHRQLGQRGGQEQVTLQLNDIPSHTHTFTPLASSGEGEEDVPTGNLPGSDIPLYAAAGNLVDLHAPQVGNAGGGLSHNNMQPYTTLTYVICLQGVFPSRN